MGLLVPVVLFALLWAGVHFLGRATGSVKQGDAIRLIGADRSVLLRQGGFYAGLSAAGRARFDQRVVELVYEKDWIGRDLTVTREMKVRIAGAIAQVTFGFADLLLLHFRKVVVYPDAYRNPRTGRMHIGEVAPGAGLLVFSWKHFTEGYEHPSDARNVAVHEVAHALWFENTIPNAEDDFLDRQALKRWQELATAEMARIKAGQGALFRAYAATNQAEFFAVAVEYFFEQTLLFRQRSPELYATLCVLLRQDPARALHHA